MTTDGFARFNGGGTADLCCREPSSGLGGAVGDDVESYKVNNRHNSKWRAMSHLLRDTIGLGFATRASYSDAVKHITKTFHIRIAKR